MTYSEWGSLEASTGSTCTADIQEKSKCNNFTGLTGFGLKSTEVLFCKFDHDSKQTLERRLIAMQCIGSTKGFCFVLTSYLYYKYYLIFIRFPNLNISFAFDKLHISISSEIWNENRNGTGTQMIIKNYRE